MYIFVRQMVADASDRSRMQGPVCVSGGMDGNSGLLGNSKDKSHVLIRSPQISKVSFDAPQFDSILS